MSKIISIATQAGPYQVPMCDLANYIEKTIEGNTAHRKFNFLMRDKSILMKNSVIPDFMPACSEFKLFTKENPNPSTEKRMEVFQQTALQLAYDTSLVAIEKSKIKHENISHIITVSCTGLYAPGLEILLAEKLGLSNNVQRYAVNFMGCYAAFHAIRLANMIAKQDDKANVLVVSIELCSLHYRNINEDDNLLSIYLLVVRQP